MQQGGISVAAVYCNRCGCENSSDRSACVRCLNALAWPPGGNVCGNCGGDNSSNALYCFNCGEPLGDAETAPDWSLAVAITLALGGEAELGAADEVDEEEFIAADGEEPTDVPDLDFDEPAAEDLGLPDDEAEEPEMFEEVETLDLADESAEDSEFAPQIPEEAAPEVDQVALEELAIELDEPAEEAEPAAEAEPAEEAADGESEETPAESEDGGDDEDDSVFGGWALELDEE